MPEKPCYVASDVHLGAVPRATERAFLRWLEHVGAEASCLILAGDLFDFWFEYRRVVLRDHFRVLAALAAVVGAGVPVTLVGGNHDWWGGSFLRDEIGVDFHGEPCVVDAGGYRALVAHGDGLGHGDLGYRALRRVLRSRLTRWAFRWVHPDIGARIAELVSETEVGDGEPTEDQLRCAAMLEEWAVARLSADRELDMVILGHTHLPAVRAVDGPRYYVNAGDWIHHYSYVVIVPGAAPRLERWPAPREGAAAR